jgi:hypothetical protein
MWKKWLGNWERPTHHLSVGTDCRSLEMAKAQELRRFAREAPSSRKLVAEYGLAPALSQSVSLETLGDRGPQQGSEATSDHLGETAARRLARRTIRKIIVILI